MGRLLLLIGLVLFGCPIAQAADSAYLTQYNALLKSHVHAGEKQGIKGNLVDYKSWSADTNHAAAMQKLGAALPESLSGKEAMAFWINAYNLLTIDLIIQQNEQDSIKKIGGIIGNAWKDYHWTIGGKRYALDEIEHTILRKMGDPRIHMAINCASLSCPDLRTEAYIAEKLDAQLNEQVSIFLRNEGKGLHKTETGITISKIFDWFEEDFKAGGGVAQFIRSHDPSVAKDTHIDGYFDYNWKLNGNW